MVSVADSLCVKFVHRSANVFSRTVFTGMDGTTHTSVLSFNKQLQLLEMQSKTQHLKIVAELSVLSGEFWWESGYIQCKLVQSTTRITDFLVVDKSSVILVKRPKIC